MILNLAASFSAPSSLFTFFSFFSPFSFPFLQWKYSYLNKRKRLLSEEELQAILAQKKEQTTTTAAADPPTAAAAAPAAPLSSPQALVSDGIVTITTHPRSTVLPEIPPLRMPASITDAIIQSTKPTENEASPAEPAEQSLLGIEQSLLAIEETAEKKKKQQEEGAVAEHEKKNQQENELAASWQALLQYRQSQQAPAVTLPPVPPLSLAPSMETTQEKKQE